MARNPPASAGDTGWIPVRKIPHSQGQLAPGAETAEPALWGPRAAATEARTPQSPRSATREDTALRSPRSAAAEQPPLATTGESPPASEKTQHSQKQLKKKKKVCILEKAMVPPLQYSCLENPMDGGASWDTVHGVAMSRTQLSDFTFTFYFHALYIG